MKTRRVLNVFLVFMAVIWPAHSASVAPAADSKETEYFAVFVEGKKVGHAVQSRVVSSGTVTTSEKTDITISRMGTPMRMLVEETSTETATGEPISFKVKQQLGAVVMRISGRVDKQGKVIVTTTSLGTSQKSTFQWPQGAVMAEGLRLLTLKKGLEEGAEYSAMIFSPGILQVALAHMHVGPKRSTDLLGRVVDTTEITTSLTMPEAGEIVSTSYVDENLRVLKDITPVAGVQVEMIGCAREFALGGNDVVDLIDKMFLPSPEPLDNLDQVQSITYDLVPTGRAAHLVIPSSDSQTVQQLKDGKAIVMIESIPAPAGAKFPYKGPDEVIMEATKPTRFLQSDNEQVINLAERAVGGTHDAAEAVKKIEAFVAEYIENRDLSVGYGSAAEVAASRQGDCTEFAVLTAPMCRAVGIPGQVVVGVAYVDNFAGRQGFGVHAWTQAYVGDKWIGLDAAFKSAGRDGYDPGHIALAVGDGEPGDFFNLEATLGQFEIEKLVVKRK